MKYARLSLGVVALLLSYSSVAASTMDPSKTALNLEIAYSKIRIDQVVKKTVSLFTHFKTYEEMLGAYRAKVPEKDRSLIFERKLAEQGKRKIERVTKGKDFVRIWNASGNYTDIVLTLDALKKGSVLINGAEILVRGRSFEQVQADLETALPRRAGILPKAYGFLIPSAQALVDPLTLTMIIIGAATAVILADTYLAMMQDIACTELEGWYVLTKGPKNSDERSTLEKVCWFISNSPKGAGYVSENTFIHVYGYLMDFVQSELKGEEVHSNNFSIRENMLKCVQRILQRCNTHLGVTSSTSQEPSSSSGQ